MSPTDTATELVVPFVSEHPTRAADDEGLGSRATDEKCRLGWESIINDYLIEWGRDPSALADDDLIPPSGKSIRLACIVATDLRDEGAPPPLRVVPDGEGGISFERRAGTCFQSLNVLENGSVELLTFEDCRLVSRVSLA